MRNEYENIAKNTRRKSNKLNSCIYKEQICFTFRCFFSSVSPCVLGHVARESCCLLCSPCTGTQVSEDCCLSKDCRTGVTVVRGTADQCPFFVHETKHIDFPVRNNIIYFSLY